jgi:hypothetical protein
MPTPINNRFTSYDLSESELKQAVLLNPLQKAYLQNMLSGIAEQILNMDCGLKAEREDYEIQRSFLKGQMTICQTLLDSSAAMEVNILEEAKNQAASQNDFVVNAGPNLFNHFTSDPL